MKIQALYDLHQEINRLFIAGSKFAKNDPRLSKYLPILNKLGEKAPVFKKLAQGIEDLTQADPVNSADKLLDLGTLLYSILYTQGEMAEETEVSALIPELDLKDINTQSSYLELQPVIEALSTSKQGRMDVVQDGFNRGIFNDFRTFGYINDALGDKYSDLADFIENTIIPSIGTRMVPFLKSSFSYEGKSENVRRFRLLYKFNDPDIEGMIGKVLEGSEINMQAEAVRMLGDDIRNQPLVITLADDKHKPVREAAYLALARYNSKESVGKLTDVFLKNKNKGNVEGIVAALKKLPHFIDEVYQKVCSDFEACIGLDKDANDKDLQNTFEKFRLSLNALYEKQEEKAVAFQEEILTNKKFNTIVSFRKTILQSSGCQIGRDIADNLGNLGERGREALRRITENTEALRLWGTDIVPYYFSACAEAYSPQEMYDTFSGHYKSKRFDSNIFISTYLVNPIRGYYGSFYWPYMRKQEIRFDRIDKRWVDLLLERAVKDDSALFIAISCDIQNEKIRTIISDQLNSALKNKKVPDNFLFYIEKAAEADLPDFPELVTSVFENSKNLSTYYLSYYLYNDLKDSPALKKFPRSYEARFRKLFESNQNEVFIEIANVISQNEI